MAWNPNKFVELSIFALSYLAAKEDLEADPQGETHLKEAERLYSLASIKKGFRELAEDAYVKIMEADESTRKLRIPKSRAALLTKPNAALEDHGDFFKRYYNAVKKQGGIHGALGEAIFKNKSPAKDKASKLARICEKDGISLLSDLASIPNKQRKHVAWINGALEIVGTPRSTFEKLEEEVNTANEIAKEIGAVEQKIKVEDPVSQKSASLEEVKRRKKDKLERIIEKSDNPGIIASNAIKTIEDASKSRTAERIGLNAEQERAMLAEGKVIIPAGAGSGKCIRHDSLVQTTQGFIEIGELSSHLEKDKDEPLEMMIHGPEGPEPTSHIYRNGWGSTKKVLTRRGYEIEGTPNHRIFSLKEGKIDWVRLDKVKKGDFVCIDRREGLFSSDPFVRSEKRDTKIPQELDCQVASLLGYVVSEGYFREKTISIFTSDEEQLELYRAATHGILNVHEHSDDRFETRDSVKFLSFHRKEDLSALKDFGLTQVLSYKKEIPKGILRSPKPVLTSFLKALFDGDGSAYNNTVEYCTVSEKLASQLHTVLLGYGIVSTKKEKKTSSDFGRCWMIRITGDDLRKFTSEIGFNLSYKQDHAESVAAKVSNTNLDLIPEIQELCKNLRSSYKKKYGTTKTKHPDYGTVKCYCMGSRNPSHSGLKKLLNLFFDPQLQEWKDLNRISSSYYYEEVVSVEDSQADTSDFVVPGSHAFHANGFINHNTRTLAAKIVYLLEEKGVDPGSLLVTSFSRKASKEIESRVLKMAENPSGVDTSVMGTSHSLIGRILRNLGGGTLPTDILEEWKVKELVKIAIEQVKLETRFGGVDEAPEDGFFSKRALQPIMRGRQVPSSRYGGRGGNYRRRGKRATTDRFVYETTVKLANFFESHQAPVPEDIRLAKTASEMRLNGKVAMDPEIQDLYSRILTAAHKAAGSVENLKYWKKSPAGEWFNVGMDSIIDGKPVLPRDVLLKMSKWKGNMISPTEAVRQSDDPYTMFCAYAYGAYEWLKTHTAETLGQRDHDDTLIMGCQLLVAKPDVLKGLQQKYSYIMIDEAQDLNYCVSQDTLVRTKEKEIPLKNVEIGQKILSYNNGSAVFKEVLAKEKSCKTEGYRIHLKSGKTITTTKNHRFYATRDFQINQEELVLYLMYREDKGFRIGTTRRPWRNKKGAGRARGEKADCLWVLEVGSQEDILYKEQALSLTFSVPTYVFEATVRGCDQKRVDKIFKEFGHNGLQILQKYDLYFNLPHWISDTYTYNDSYSRKVLSFCAHRGGKYKGNVLNTTFQKEEDISTIPEEMLSYNLKGGRKTVYKKFASYDECQRMASKIASLEGWFVSENILIEDQKLYLQSASGLMPGMKLPVHQNGFLKVEDERSDIPSIASLREEASLLGMDLSSLGLKKKEIYEKILLRKGENPESFFDDTSIVLEEIDFIEEVPEDVFYDIKVKDSGNFFGNSILSHNCQDLFFGLVAGTHDPTTREPHPDGKYLAKTICYIGDDKQAIYEFRGASPQNFSGKSDLTPGGQDFESTVLTMNFRSGSKIVDSANRLAAYNDDQIPMVCQPSPSKGEGSIKSVSARDEKECADMAAEEIASAVREEQLSSYKDFGIALRSNKEVDTYIMSLIENGIPFVSRRNPLNNVVVNALRGWLQLYSFGQNGGNYDTDTMNRIITKAHLMPNRMLGKVFVNRVEMMGGDDYFQYLKNGGWKKIYDQAFRNKNVKSYIDTIEGIMMLGRGEDMDPERLVRTLLKNVIGAQGKTLEDAIRELRNFDKNAAEETPEEQEKNDGDNILMMQDIQFLLNMMNARGGVVEGLAYLREMEKISEDLNRSKKEETEADIDAVRVDTIHQWKGLEADHIYTSFGPNFPHKRWMEVEGPGYVKSERRLAYVAITRGRDSVTVFAPEEVNGFAAGASQFLSEACIPSNTNLEKNASIRKHLDKTSHIMIKKMASYFIKPEGA